MGKPYFITELQQGSTEGDAQQLTIQVLHCFMSLVFDSSEQCTTPALAGVAQDQEHNIVIQVREELLGGEDGQTVFDGYTDTRPTGEENDQVTSSIQIARGYRRPGTDDYVTHTNERMIATCLHEIYHAVRRGAAMRQAQRLISGWSGSTSPAHKPARIDEITRDSGWHPHPDADHEMIGAVDSEYRIWARRLLDRVKQLRVTGTPPTTAEEHSVLSMPLHLDVLYKEFSSEDSHMAPFGDLHLHPEYPAAVRGDAEAALELARAMMSQVRQELQGRRVGSTARPDPIAVRLNFDAQLLQPPADTTRLDVWRNALRIAAAEGQLSIIRETDRCVLMVGEHATTVDMRPSGQSADDAPPPKRKRGSGPSSP